VVLSPPGWRVIPPAQARLWLRTPLAGLDWRKPLDVVVAGGYLDVLAALPERPCGHG